MLSTEKERLNYSETGKGEVLCLLHGFLENKSMWNPFLKILSSHYKVLAIDLPGHGDSLLPEKELTMQTMAKAVDDILTSKGISNIKFIGHSMGGYVALEYANIFPDKVAGILLLNSTPEADTSERKELRAHGINVAKKNYKALISMSVANLFSHELRPKLKKEIEHTQNEALKTSRESYISCQKAMSLRSDHCDLWEKSSFKKTFILGSQDTLLNADYLIKKFEKNKVESVVLEGGHMLHLENKELLLEHLAEF